MRRLLEAVLPVRSGERRLTLLLFLHGFFVIGAVVCGRAVRDALLLSRGPPGALPWLITGAAAVVALAGLVYGRVAARVRRDHMAVAGGLTFAALYGVAWWLLPGAAPWLTPALYVAVDLVSALALLQFWTLVSELFHTQEAKRLYGLIGAGGTVANIGVGLAITEVARALGTGALLLLSGVLCAAAACAAAAAGTAGRQRLVARRVGGAHRRRAPRGGALRVLGHPHQRGVALLAAVTFATTTLVDYAFKVVARGSLEGDALAAFFGQFSTGVGVVALGLQLFGTSRLLQGAGVIAALALLPVSLGAGGLVLALAPTLWAAAAAKGADSVLRYSVNDAGAQLLLLPLPARERVEARALIDGVVKPGATALTGLVLVAAQAGGAAGPVPVAWAAVALCGAWVALLWVLRGRYIGALQDTLRRRRLLDRAGLRGQARDEATRAALRRALESPDAREVLTGLELLAGSEAPPVDAHLEPLLEHTHPRVRAAALGLLARWPRPEALPALERRLEDPESFVQVAAVRAVCAAGGARALPAVARFLSDPDPALCGAAIAGLVLHGGLEATHVATGALLGLIRHPEASVRAQGAAVLGELGLPAFHPSLQELLEDPEVRVRRRALQAAGRLRSPALVRPLVTLGLREDVGQDAVEALGAYGEPAVPALAELLEAPRTPPTVRWAVARVLGRIPCAEAVRVVMRNLDTADEALRTRLSRALGRLVQVGWRGAVDRPGVRAALDRELTRAYGTLAAAEALQLPTGPTVEPARAGVGAAEALLGAALHERVQAAEERVLLLLAVLYPDAGLEHLPSGLRDGAEDAPRRRANAVELLDTLLERALKAKVVPLLEDAPRTVKLRAVEGASSRSSAEREGTLRDLCRDGNPWVRACALFLAAEAGAPLPAELLDAACADPDPVVREMALRAAGRLLPTRARLLAEARLGDVSATVRAQAARLLADHTRAA